MILSVLKENVGFHGWKSHNVRTGTRLTADTCLTADPGVASAIPAHSHTFTEIDHEIISSLPLIPKGCCQ